MNIIIKVLLYRHDESTCEGTTAVRMSQKGVSSTIRNDASETGGKLGSIGAAVNSKLGENANVSIRKMSL